MQVKKEFKRNDSYLKFNIITDVWLIIWRKKSLPLWFCGTIFSIENLIPIFIIIIQTWEIKKPLVNKRSMIFIGIPPFNNEKQHNQCYYVMISFPIYCDVIPANRNETKRTLIFNDYLHRNTIPIYYQSQYHTQSENKRWSDP